MIILTSQRAVYLLFCSWESTGYVCSCHVRTVCRGVQLDGRLSVFVLFDWVGTVARCPVKIHLPPGFPKRLGQFFSHGFFDL